MSLSLGLDVARSGLATVGEQVSIASRNIARAGDPDATRKTARVVTGPGSSVHIARFDRASDVALLEKFLQSKSSASTQAEINNALNSLEGVVGDPDSSRSPAALLAELQSSLQKFAVSPGNAAFASSVVGAARNISGALNDGSSALDSVRRQADADIAAAVDRSNSLLEQFKDLNETVISGVRRGIDVTDAMDARDGIIKSLSAEIGINVLRRSDGDIAIFTESGITLFDRIPRSISFNATPLLASGASGSALYADGVPILGAQNSLTVSNGRIAGLFAVRDEVAPTFQTQLDEIARGLISAFAEYDQSPTPTLPAAAGLFTYSGGPGIPASGMHVAGLAGSIRINATVDPDAGGNPFLIRDGAISNPGNPAYTYNATGAVSFTDRIEELVGKLRANQTFDTAAGLTSTSSVLSFAKDSVGWLEQMRKSSQAEADHRDSVSERAGAILSKDTGVSLDEEMTNVLELERAYQASSRLISTIDAMLESLIAAMR